MKAKKDYEPSHHVAMINIIFLLLFAIDASINITSLLTKNFGWHNMISSSLIVISYCLTLNITIKLDKKNKQRYFY
jgi:uncharacterized integral membrane protein